MSNTLFVTLVVDCSGSMGTIAPAMNSAISEALGALENESRTVILDVWQFADTVRHTIKGASPHTVVGQALVVPRGMTALNDAIGWALVDLDDRVSDGDQVRVLIVTDGLENSSREWTTEGVKTLVEQRKVAGWDIAYMGANVDVATETATRGINTSLRYDATDVGVRAASVSMSSYLSTGAFGEPAIDPETVTVTDRRGLVINTANLATGGPILSVSASHPFLSSFTPSVHSQDWQ